MKRSLLLTLALVVIGCGAEPRDPEAEAEAEALQQACDGGDILGVGVAEGCYNLGVMYANGRGVPLDDAEAVRWYRLAADQGFDRAQTSLGFYYREGLGVPQDYAEAVRWYRLAAEQGNVGAQGSLGLMGD